VGVTESTAVLFTPAKDAVSVTDVIEATLVVVTVKFAAIVPDVTVTFGGTAATVGLELDKVTTVPAGGAAPVKVTVPVVDAPPTTLEGFSASKVRAAAVTV
jgi:hypothetical protein